MTSIHTTLGRPPGDGLVGPAPRRPRTLLDWEDMLTLAAALVAFVSVGFSLQAAGWVKEMPPFLPTVCVALLAGMVGARSRLHAAAAFPLGLAAGVVMVLLAALIYVEGATISDRLLAFRTRMQDWFTIVRAGDVSNDNLPFVVLVHAVTFIAVFFAAWSIYRWRSVWPAVIPAAVIVLANIAFIDDQPVAPFIVFIFGAIVLVGRMHIQKNIARWTAEGVEYPEFISLSTIQLTAFAGAAIVTAAWLLPLGGQGGAFEAVADTVARPVTSRSDDFVRLFSNLNTGKGGNLHNFGKTLPIRGDVSLGRKKLLEVTSSEPGLVRATSYDIYTGAGWKKGSREDIEVLAGAGAGLAADGNAIGPYAQRQLSQIDVLVVDPEDTIITAGVPLAASVDAVAKTPAGTTEADELRSASGLEAGDTYTAIGSVSTASAEQLAAAGTDYPGWVAERYLQLPDDLPARVQGETVRIITETGARTPLEAAAAIEAYVGAFPYDTLVEAPPPGRDAVDFLLFDLQKGYFDYQSSAMCVMLRTVGVPCRVAVGYVLDPDNALADVYTVRKTQAYSWVEVFFPTYGWVDFNPSIAPLDEATSGPLVDGLSEEPPIVDLPAEDLFGPAIDLGDVDPGAVLDSFNDAGSGGGGFNWMLLWLAVGVLGIVGAGAGTMRMLWVRGLGGMDADRRLWAKTQRLAGWAGLGIAGGETAREWSGRMGDAVGLKPEAERLATAYEAQRYGPPDSTAAGGEEVESAYRRLRGALTRKILRRR